MNALTSSYKNQLALVGITLLLCSLGSARLFPAMGVDAGALLVVPLLVTAYLFNVRAVLVVLAASAALTGLLLQMGGHEEWLAGGTVRGTILLLVIGVGAAQLRQMNRRLQQVLRARGIMDEEMKRRNEELAGLQEASLQITRSLELQPILQKIVETAVRLAQVEVAQVFLYDGKDLTFGAGYWDGRQQDQPYSHPRQGGATYEVAWAGSPMFISDVDAHPLYRDWQWGGAIAFLPLSSGDSVNGVMNIAYHKPHFFDENEKRILRLLATQAAVAIQNAELYEAARQQATHLEAYVSARTAELLNAKERAETILNNSFDAIIVFSPEYGIEQINPAFRALFGYEVEAIVQETLPKLIHPDSRDAVLATLRQVAATGQSARAEATLLRRDGTQFFADIALAGFPGEDGTRTNIICSLRDISARKRAEAQQQAMTSGLRTVLAVANELMSCSDVDTVFRHTVEAARNQLGVERCAIFLREGRFLRGTFGTDMEGNTTDEHTNGFPINKVWEERFERLTPQEAQWLIVHDDDLYTWTGERTEIIGRGWLAIHRIQLAEGATALFIIDAAISNRPLDATQQEIVAVFCSLVGKIIERKRIEQDIRWALQHEVELGELKTRFISNISHEFRTPLAIIQTSTQLLKYYHDRMNALKQEQHLDKIEAQVAQITMLLDNVLTISRAEAVGLPYNPTPIDMVAFCAAVVEEIRLTTNESHQIVMTREGDAFTYELDENLLRQIVTNLLTNAVKYSPDGTTIHLNLFCEPRQVVIRIRDEGIGIPEEDQKRLFEDFHRGKNVGTISGTGLGLSIVKRAVQVHGGIVTVESKVGVGTTFTVRLPTQEAKPEITTG